MKLLKLKLRGAIGIMKGLGVDEIEIDFTQFEPGLIALTGDNGSGKTTIMENMHPYRTLVSRSGSLQSQFFLKDSYRILEFAHEGKLFRTQIYIDALTGGSEAYLFIYPNGYDGTADALNDGKLTTYDIEIEKLLGSQDLFFNSVFSGQKSKGIAELKPADRRKLFYELLNLNIYETYLETAKAELKKLEIKLSETEGYISALQPYGDNLEELNTLIMDLTGNEVGFENTISEIEKQIEQTESKIRESEIKLSSLDEKIKTNEEIKNKLLSLQEKYETGNASYTNNRNALLLDVEAARTAIERDKKLIAIKGEIEAKIADIYNCTVALRILKNDRSDFQEQLSTVQHDYTSGLQSLTELSSDIAITESSIKELEAKHDKVLVEMSRIDEDAERIDNSGCDSPTKGAACEFLSNAHKGLEKIDDLESMLSETKNAINETSGILNEKTVEHQAQKDLIENKYAAESETLQTKINYLNSSIKTLENELDELDKSDWTKFKKECDAADNNIKLNEVKIESLDKQIDTLAQSRSERMKEFSDETKELEEKLDNQIHMKINQEKEVLNFLTGQKTDLQGSINVERLRLTTLNAEISTTNQKIETAKQSETKIKELEVSKQFTQSEIKDWAFLCKSFDKAGIPVLKLENSGIEITSIANELLSLFENKFRIVFETTSLKKDKKTFKETFDINIVEDDGVTEIANKSGGEQVWLETAIQLAISQVAKRQGKNIETGFLDEKDGALDLSNAMVYVDMIRRSHEMSGVHNTFVITHRTELLDYIPQQVKLVDGYLQIINN